MEVFAAEERKARGGKRPGSGRHKRDTVQLTVRISAKADRYLREVLCASAAPGKVVEDLILASDQSL
jgi:hypothetical protein